MKTIKPDFFANFPSLKRDEEARKKGANDDERMYYGMSQTAGWKLFKEKCNELMEEMDKMNETAVANGLSYEELGKNTIVISLAKGVIRRLLNLVEDSKEACESGGQ